MDQLIPCSQLVQVTLSPGGSGGVAPGEPRRGVAGAPAGLPGLFAGAYDGLAIVVIAPSRLGVFMHRMPVNKHRSAKQFKRNIRKTKAPNMKAAPMRGGIRL